MTHDEILKTLAAAYKYSDDGDGPGSDHDEFYRDRAWDVNRYLNEMGYKIVKANRVKIYGINEIAEAVGARPATVSAWYARGKLPKPTQLLARMPVWQGKEIEEWIAVKSRRAD